MDQVFGGNLLPRDLFWIVGLYCFNHKSLWNDKKLLHWVEKMGRTISGHEDGDYMTLLFGRLHSFNDKPAVVQGSTKIWFWWGFYHREDGPCAISEKPDHKMWYTREDELTWI